MVHSLSWWVPPLDIVMQCSIAYCHVGQWGSDLENPVAPFTNMVYSEKTWAVGIAQLTHHEVQGGGKNPETGGRGIFAPTADRVVS